MRHFLTIQDLSIDEIEGILNKTKDLKRREFQPLLKGKTLAMIFEKPSTRTRVSFELAASQLGGHVLFMRKDELQLGRGETIADTARVLSRYVDFICARVYEHETLEELAKHSSVPVINALSNFTHPCQILADLFTIKEKFGSLKGLKLAYVGDGNNVCNSLLIGCSKVGINISVACPEGYEPDVRAVNFANKNAKINLSEIEITKDPAKTVLKADIIYTDTWVSMGDEAEKEKRMKVFKKYQVNSQLTKRAKKNYIFMHCLPAHRGQEVTDEIIDGPNSVVWDQAENRLHVQKALLLFLKEHL